MTKSRQDFHRNAENVPKSFAGQRQKYLKLEKTHPFSARGVAKFGKKGQKPNP